MGVAAAVGGAILGGVSHIKQQKEQKKARKSQERAQALQLEEQKKSNAIQQKAIAEQNRLQKKAADTATQRARVASIREARIRRGQLVAAGAAQGTLNSSGFSGASSSISSQLTGNIAYGASQRDTATQLGDLRVDTSEQLGDNSIFYANAVGNQNVAAARAQGNAATWGAIGQFGQGVFNQAGGFKTIFKKIGQPNPGFTYNG